MKGYAPTFIREPKSNVISELTYHKIERKTGTVMVGDGRIILARNLETDEEVQGSDFLGVLMDVGSWLAKGCKVELIPEDLLDRA